MSEHKPRILISGRMDKIVDELSRDESLKGFVLEYIPDVKHVVSMLPQIGDAYTLVFLSSDSNNTDQLLAGLTPFSKSSRNFLFISLSVGSQEDISRLLSNPAILSMVPKPLSSEVLARLFCVFGNDGPWSRMFE